MTDNSPTRQMNRQSTKLAHMQGGLWNQYTDAIEDNIYTRNKDKIQGQKYHSKTIQNA